MLSLCIYLVSTAIYAVAMAAGLAITARAVGSARGRFWPAMGVVGLLVAVTVMADIVHLALADQIATAAMRGFDPRADGPDMPRLIAARQGQMALLVAIAHLVASYGVIRWWFRLSAGRAFAPFGAYFGGLMGTVAIGLVALQPYVSESYSLPTSSMGPTLVAGDRLSACKFLRPHRWDIVVYHDETSQRHPIFCKRVIALPGETLTFDGAGGIAINGVPTPAPAVLSGRLFAVPNSPARSMAKYADGQPIQLSDREAFLVGDNVDLSYDSRFTGPSHVSSIIGVVDLAYWPIPHVRVLGR